MSAERFTPRQAPDALPDRAIARVAVLAIVITLVAIGVAGLLLRAFRPPPGAATSARAPSTLGGIEQPPLDVARRGLDLRERQRRELDRYQWVDREHGIVTIPIDRAIDLTVERAR